LAADDRYTIDASEFEEDELPAWLLKQRRDALETEAAANASAPRRFEEGERIGEFIFVRYGKYRNRGVFACAECGRKFQYNLYAIARKKRCKWQRLHARKG